jgi:hypothetical protein
MFVSDGIVNEFPAIKLLPEKVVDTNGAGDAFVGGEFTPHEYCFVNNSVLILYHMDMQVFIETCLSTFFIHVFICRYVYMLSMLSFIHNRQSNPKCIADQIVASIVGCASSFI